jgi:tRNA(fMet)-specific endonuclease VapC
MRYLLDTNTASHMIRKDNQAVDQWRAKVAISELAVSTVTEGELRFGAARVPQALRLRAAIEEYLLDVTVLPWDSNAAREYGELRASLERDGRTIGSLDMMIAAHALALGFILVSSDSAFRRIKRLKVEDWTKA